MSTSEQEGLVLIGAGLSRTGTSSTKLALESLLGGECYHGWTVMEGEKDHYQHFRNAVKGKATAEDWKKVLAGYKAGLDIPIQVFYKELMAIYPNAKVLLTVRDPVAWYQSVLNTIYPLDGIAERWPYSWFLYLTGKAEGFLTMGDLTKKQGLYKTMALGEQAALRFWDDHIKDVMENVPKEKLLVWNSEEGWKPLCEFLGVPTPECPFPRVNDKKKMEKLRKKLEFNSWLLIVAIFLFILTLGLLWQDMVQVSTFTLAGVVTTYVSHKREKREWKTQSEI